MSSGLRRVRKQERGRKRERINSGQGACLWKKQRRTGTVAECREK
jgi:hypothetical protein